MTIANNLKHIKKIITDCEAKNHRQPGSVKLLAASKQQSIEKILEAYAAGQTRFGENYVQEALPKIAALADKDIEWHFIGPIQSNKTRKIAEHFSWVHSVDDLKIAQRLNDQRPENLPRLNICIEVNISHEKTKSGISIEQASAFAKACVELPRLQLRGLMAIPEALADFASQRREFNKLTTLFNALRAQNISLDTLSMGMSEDFEAAIAEGATIVRIGTAIFGARR